MEPRWVDGTRVPWLRTNDDGIRLTPDTVELLDLMLDRMIQDGKDDEPNDDISSCIINDDDG